MLKVLSIPTDITPATKTKCGEIYYHSFNDFTIFCTFCQMKSFQFDDFLQHLQNVHLENSVVHNTKEFDNYLQLDIKNETILQEKPEEKAMWDQMASNTEHSENEDCVTSSEEEKLMVLKQAKRRILKKKKCKRSPPDIKYDDEPSSDEPEIHKKSLKDGAESCSNSKKKHKDVDYTCTECSEIFSQKKFLDHHVVELHNGYKCSLCDKRFRRSYHVTYHMKTHTSEKNYICPMENCGRGFIDEDYLKRHMEVHTMERTFICDYENCGKAFQTHRRLASHKYTHRIPKKFVCDMCGHSCRSNTELITHQRVHTGEKPFPCEVCSKPFISKTALTEHMISHLETRPHVCPVCNAAFANRRVLVRHSFIHSDEKTFKCKLCASAFKHPNSLQGHIRNVHREPKVKGNKKLADT